MVFLVPVPSIELFIKGNSAGKSEIQRFGYWLDSKMANFADVQYCIYADQENGWVRKSPEI